MGYALTKSGAVADSHVTVIRPFSNDISSEYLYAYFSSLTVQIVIEEKADGSTKQKELSTNTVKSYLVPLPPTEEQVRIVDIILHTKPIIDRYGNLYEHFTSVNNNLNTELRKSILQEAIQGRLVSQIASEGTADELLKEIEAEKKRLVKEGKLKKSALTASRIFRGDDNKYYEQIGSQILDITEEIPFELPNSWSWVRGSSVFLPMESIKPTSDFTYIDLDAVNNNTNQIEQPKSFTPKQAPSRATRKLHIGDVLFSMVRPYLRNIALIDEHYQEAIASTGFYIISPQLAYVSNFMLYLCLTPYVINGLNQYMKGDNSPSINNSHIEQFLYPLPPLSEQKRIVAQIETLFKRIK